MKKFIITILAGLVLAGVSTRAFAEDKVTTITGDMVCGKCTLHETASCQNVVQVTQDGKTVNYYLKQNGVSKDAHEAVCHGDTEKVTVTGTVKDEGDKHILTATKIEEAK